MLKGVLKRQAAQDIEGRAHLETIRSRREEAETRLKRLFAMVETGVMEIEDTTLKTRLNDLRDQRDLAMQAEQRAVDALKPEAKLTEDKLEQFSRTMQFNIANGDIKFRREYLRAVFSNIIAHKQKIELVIRR